MLKVSAIIMAAGASSRMGENKLLLKLNGLTLIEHFISNYPTELFHNTIAVYSEERVGDVFRNSGVETALNSSDGDKCVTIKLGTEKCLDSNGLMFFVADQPFLKSETISAIVSAFKDEPDKIIIPVCDGKNRNPVIFPSDVFGELANLRGDLGGRDVINEHPELVRYMSINDVEQFLDIDTPADLSKAKEYLRR